MYYNDATTTGAYFCGVVENTADWSSINSFTGTGQIRLADISHGGSMISTVTCNIPGGGSQLRAITLDEQ